MNYWNEILVNFKMLTLKDKQDMIKKLQSIVDAEKAAPEKTPLEEAWDEIQRDIFSLSLEPYIDDQLEIEDAWNICEDLVKGGELEDESWDLRERILRAMIKNDLYDYYGLIDPMEDLMRAMCTTQAERIRCADLIYSTGDDFMKQYGAKIYKENGQPQKYYDYLEKHLTDEEKEYQKLIDYYRDCNPEKAEAIAELALKKCRRDQTDFMIFLMERARKNGDEEKFRKLLKGAQRRRAVNQQKIKDYLESRTEETK